MGLSREMPPLNFNIFTKNAAVGQQVRLTQMFFFLLHPSKQPEPQISPAPHVR